MTTPSAAIEHFGVTLRFVGFPGLEAEFAVGHHRTLTMIDTMTAEARSRQSRSARIYEDILTWWAAVPVPALVKNSEEGALLDDLMDDLGNGILMPQALLNLGANSLVASARSSFGVLHGLRRVFPSTPAGMGLGAPLRWGPGHLEGRWLVEDTGVIRRFEVDIPDAESRTVRRDWFWLTALAALVRLRAALESWIDHGAQLPVRRCERAGCGGWYRVPRMAARPPRFCSSYCRVSASRETPE